MAANTRRYLATFLAGLLICTFVLPSKADQAQESERRLGRITISRASPYMGTLHVKLVVAPTQHADPYASANVELMFVPVIFGDGGEVTSAADMDDGRHRLTARRTDGDETDPYRILPTEKMVMSPGTYLLSQIRYLPKDGEDLPPKTFCLSKGSFAFDVRAQDVIYLGRLVLKPPSDIDSSTGAGPAFTDLTPLDQLTGWRRRPDALLKVTPSPISFPKGEAFCPEARLDIAGW